jgi:hypothetical protein
LGLLIDLAILAHAPASAGDKPVKSAYSPVPTLNALHEFQEAHGYENYSEGFGLTKFDDKSGLKAGWSEKPAFLAALIPFAQANGSGSFYALWNTGASKDMNEWPVVVFGDKGGEHVVASNVLELLRLITFDDEPLVEHDKVTFYKGKDHRASPEAKAYQRWLKATFNALPPTDHDALVASAQKKHQAAFNAWKRRFLKWLSE